MCSLEGLREFINDRLSAAAVEIFTVVEKTVVQYQEDVDAQILDNIWRGGTNAHSTGFRRQHVWKEDSGSFLDQKEPEPPQTQDDEGQVVVKQEVDAFVVTAVDKQSENFTPHDFVRRFTSDRLSAAAAEIFTKVEQTIVQHQEENRTRHRLLKINLKPQIRLIRIENLQQYLENPLWKQKTTSSLDKEEKETPKAKEEPELSQIKEEQQEELSISLKGDDLLLKPETDAFIDTPIGEIIEPKADDGQDQHDCKEEQFYDQEIKSDQREPEPPLIKEEPQTLYISLEEEQLEPKHEYDAVMVTLTDEKNDQSELDGEQCLPHSSDITETQVQIKGQHQDLGSTKNRKPELKKKHNSKNRDKFPVPDIQCETEPSKKCLLCGDCGKTFQCISLLKRHQRIHTGEKPFQCKTCEKSFTDSSSLKRHIMIHTGEKPHPCETCGKCFCRPHHLLVHKRTHTGEKPYACKHCGRAFSQQSTVLAHMRTHTGEKPHSCEICGKGFYRPDQLLTHKWTHTSEKPYSCDTCGKNFSRQSNLLVHKRSHTGEKPFQCLACEKKFKDSSSLKQHSMIHTGEKRHYCMTCGKGFIQHSSLLVHLRTHTGEKPHSCMTCGKSFSQKSNLLVHMRSHTNEMLKSLKIPTHLLNPLL